MIELRWMRTHKSPKGMVSEGPAKLQYRYTNAEGYMWCDWKDVPFVDEEPKEKPPEGG